MKRTILLFTAVMLIANTMVLGAGGSVETASCFGVKPAFAQQDGDSLSASEDQYGEDRNTASPSEDEGFQQSSEDENGASSEAAGDADPGGVGEQADREPNCYKEFEDRLVHCPTRSYEENPGIVGWLFDSEHIKCTLGADVELARCIAESSSAASPYW